MGSLIYQAGRAPRAPQNEEKDRAECYGTCAHLVRSQNQGPIQKARFLHNFTAQNARCQAGSELMLAC